MYVGWGSCLTCQAAYVSAVLVHNTAGMMANLRADDESVFLPLVSGSARPCNVALNTQRKHVVAALLGMGPLLLHVVTCLHSAGGRPGLVAVHDAGIDGAGPPVFVQNSRKKQQRLQHDHLTALQSSGLAADSRVTAMFKLMQRKGTVKDLLLGCTQLLAAAAPLQCDGSYSLEILRYLTREAVHAWFTQLFGVRDKIAAVLCLFGLGMVSKRWNHAIPCARLVFACSSCS
jgi:hypothetical protein